VRVEQSVLGGGEGRERVREGRRMLVGRDMDGWEGGREGQLQATVGGWPRCMSGSAASPCSPHAVRWKRERSERETGWDAIRQKREGGRRCQLRGKGRTTVGRARKEEKRRRNGMK